MFDRILAELIRRGGSHLIDRAVRRVMPPAQARPAMPAPDTSEIEEGVRGQEAAPSLAKTLTGSALSRIALRSVPGAIVVGGGLLAKLAYDRKRGKRPAAGKFRG